MENLKNKNHIFILLQSFQELYSLSLAKIKAYKLSWYNDKVHGSQKSLIPERIMYCKACTY